MLQTYDRKRLVEVAKENIQNIKKYLTKINQENVLPSFRINIIHLFETLRQLGLPLSKPITSQTSPIILFSHLTSEATALGWFGFYPDQCSNFKLTLLNFADPVEPGGCYMEGVNTQEECLCRCMPLLYPSLVQSGEYPFDHEQNIIWTPKCFIQRNPQNNFQDFQSLIPISIISAAAPNRTRGELFHLSHMEQIMKSIFLIPSLFNQSQFLILGAIGLGAFANSPHDIAMAFLSVIHSYSFLYQQIIFALPDPSLFHFFISFFSQHNITCRGTSPP